MQGVLEKRLSTYHGITLEEFVEQLAGADPEDVFIRREGRWRKK